MNEPLTAEFLDWLKGCTTNDTHAHTVHQLVEEVERLRAALREIAESDFMPLPARVRARSTLAGTEADRE